MNQQNDSMMSDCPDSYAESNEPVELSTEIKGDIEREEMTEFKLYTQQELINTQQEVTEFQIDTQQETLEEEMDYTDFSFWDNKVGIIRLYSDDVLARLLRCYPIWSDIPQKEEIQLIINGGCVFYLYSTNQYVYSLGLKDSNHKGRRVRDSEWNGLFEWFARFADIITRLNYNQQWHQTIMKNIQFDKDIQYRKSFFSILANIAFCALNYTEQDDYLYSLFKKILNFEIHRDYTQEQEQIKQRLEQIIKLIQEAPEETINVPEFKEDIKQPPENDTQININDNPDLTPQNDTLNDLDEQLEQTGNLEDKSYDIQPLQTNEEQQQIHDTSIEDSLEQSEIHEPNPQTS